MGETHHRYKIGRMAKYSLPDDEDDRTAFEGLETLQLIS